MAFDFNGNNKSKDRKDDVWNDFGSDAFGSGSTSNRSGLDDFSDFPERSTGFQDKPSNQSDIGWGDHPVPAKDPSERRRRIPPKPPIFGGGARGNNVNIPWRVILAVFGLIALVVLCVVFSDAITQFLIRVLVWAIIIVILILLGKWLIFGGRRR